MSQKYFPNKDIVNLSQFFSKKKKRIERYMWCKDGVLKVHFPVTAFLFVFFFYKKSVI